MITIGAMKNEGTSRFYVPQGFPAVPDLELTSELIYTAREMTRGTNFSVYTGITSSDDAFYGETPEFLDKLRSYKVMNLDMESSALYTVAHLRSVRAATINGTSGNLTNAEVIYTKKNGAAPRCMGKRRSRSSWRPSTAWSSGKPQKAGGEGDEQGFTG